MYTSVCICIRVCALECLTHGGWKRSSDPLKLELQVVVSHLMGAEFQNLVLEEEQVLITTELSLQSLYGIVSGLFVCVLLFCVGGLVGLGCENQTQPYDSRACVLLLWASHILFPVRSSYICLYGLLFTCWLDCFHECQCTPFKITRNNLQVLVWLLCKLSWKYPLFSCCDELRLLTVCVTINSTV